jgi:hypothetical protein
MLGETAQPPGLFLFDNPAGNYIQNNDNGYYWDVLVIGGGKCVNEQMWWEVLTPEGKVGWLAENDAATWEANYKSQYYLINPATLSDIAWRWQWCQNNSSRYCTLLQGKIAIQ